VTLAPQHLVRLLSALSAACDAGDIDGDEMLVTANALLVACGLDEIRVAWENPREHTSWEAREVLTHAIGDLLHGDSVAAPRRSA